MEVAWLVLLNCREDKSEGLPQLDTPANREEKVFPGILDGGILHSMVSLQYVVIANMTS